jgi:hypothetical protein
MGLTSRQTSRAGEPVLLILLGVGAAVLVAVVLRMVGLALLRNLLGLIP